MLRPAASRRRRRGQVRWRDFSAVAANLPDSDTDSSVASIGRLTERSVGISVITDRDVDMRAAARGARGRPCPRDGGRAAIGTPSEPAASSGVGVVEVVTVSPVAQPASAFRAPTATTVAAPAPVGVDASPPRAPSAIAVPKERPPRGAEAYDASPAAGSAAGSPPVRLAEAVARTPPRATGTLPDRHYEMYVPAGCMGARGLGEDWFRCSSELCAAQHVTAVHRR